ELGVDLEQPPADDAAPFLELAQRWHAALHEEGQRGRVHPAREVRKEDDAVRVAVAELHVHRVRGDAWHRARMSLNVHRKTPPLRMATPGAASGGRQDHAVAARIEVIDQRLAVSPYS